MIGVLNSLRELNVLSLTNDPDTLSVHREFRISNGARSHGTTHAKPAPTEKRTTSDTLSEDLYKR